MNDFDPPTAIKGLKRSLYGQWKGLKALEYSRLRASGNPKKIPGLDFWESRDIPGSRRSLVKALVSECFSAFAVSVIEFGFPTSLLLSVEGWFPVFLSI